MITAAQKEYIERHAYLPEHLPAYVTSISGAEPFLYGDYLVYGKAGHLIFIGYPFDQDAQERRLEKALEEAINRHSPESISLIAPAIPPSLTNTSAAPSDHYYRLAISELAVSQKLRNTLKRAKRDLSVTKATRFTDEHRRLVEAFLAGRPVDEATGRIFRRIDAYVSASETAVIFEARTGNGDLVAFDIADCKAGDYAMYLFNFRSRSGHVPGASDLLLWAMIQQAVLEGKRYLNLGLGINPGVVFFKRKWGGEAFLPYAFCLYRNPRRKGLLELLLQRL